MTFDNLNSFSVGEVLDYLAEFYEDEEKNKNGGEVVYGFDEFMKGVI